MNAPPERLLLRADANPDVGSGHVMRCIALTQAWRAAGHAATFLSRCPVPALVHRMRDTGAEVQLLPELHSPEEETDVLACVAHDVHATAIALDGYRFDAAYQRRTKALGPALLVIDDYLHAEFYHADIVLNQNLDATQRPYRAAPHARLLLGPRYVLLRDEFRPYATWRRAIPARAKRILVTLGGSDPDNVTLRVIQSLAASGLSFDVRVVTGGANPHAEALRAMASPGGIEMLHDVHDMPRLMAWADMAISAGGTTCWEMAYMGLPNIILILSENQRDIARSLEREGVSRCAGDGNALSDALLQESLRALAGDVAARAEMARRGRALVDGHGADRVVEAILACRPPE